MALQSTAVKIRTRYVGTGEEKGWNRLCQHLKRRALKEESLVLYSLLEIGSDIESFWLESLLCVKGDKADALYFSSWELTWLELIVHKHKIYYSHFFYFKSFCCVLMYLFSSHVQQSLELLENVCWFQTRVNKNRVNLCVVRYDPRGAMQHRALQNDTCPWGKVSRDFVAPTGQKSKA